MPGVSYEFYEQFVDGLSESSPVRVAYDGRGMEIMTKGRHHEDYRRNLGRLMDALAFKLTVSFKALGETTWKRAALERGIGADDCFFFDPEKIRILRSLPKDADIALVPNPDLAVEIDISRPLADCEGIYATLGVSEMWTFDGHELVIKRLGEEGRYRSVEVSGYLRVRPVDVVRLLVDESDTDDVVWMTRMRAWVEEWRPL